MKWIFTFLFFTAITFTNSNAVSVKDLIPKAQQSYDREMFSGVFSLNNTKIYLSYSNPDYEAAYFLNQNLRNRNIDTLEISMWSPIDTLITLVTGVVLGTPDEFISTLFKYIPDQKINVTQDYPGSGGYVLDVLPSQVIIAGSDKEGLINGVKTFIQLTNQVNIKNSIMACRVVDAPDFPIRWAYYSTNILVQDNTPIAKNIWQTASNYKLNGIQLNDFKFNLLEEMPQRYFDSLYSLKNFADINRLEIIPGIFPFGYSEGILYHDVNLASGLPVKNQKFFIDNDTARLVQSLDVSLPNGGFENNSGTNIPGYLFIDKIGEISNIDQNVKHSGSVSLRMDNFEQYDPANGNGRICYHTAVKPFTQYHASAFIKTQNFVPMNSIQLNVINPKGLSLSFAYADLKPADNGWSRMDITFNTLESDTINVYWAVRGANSGTIWWDDLSLEETSFVNLVRRGGTPLTVDNPLLDVFIMESRDFDTLSDPKLGAMLSYPGNYDTWHTPPSLTIKPDGLLHNGDSILVSYYHTQTVYDGQVMCTTTDDKVYDIIENEFRQIDSVLKPARYFMNHDEIRVLNWEGTEGEYWGIKPGEVTPGNLLARNVEKCLDIIHKYNASADVWDWSDMFDIYHNAKKSGYYLVNGDLSASAETMSNLTGIVNWNNDETNSINSLNFFADLGYRQICAPYYDAGADQIRVWKERVKGVKNFGGMMYTTWAKDYSALEPFAEYAWGHAPYIYHYPPIYFPENFKLTINYQIIDDKWDSGWQTAETKLFYRTLPSDNFTEINLSPTVGADESYLLTLPTGSKWVQYYLTATDNRGSSKKIPYGDTVYFELGERPLSVDHSGESLNISIFPNPVTENEFIVSSKIENIAGMSFSVSDLLGNEMLMGRFTSNENVVNLKNLSNGIYRINIFSINKFAARKFIIAR